MGDRKKHAIRESSQTHEDPSLQWYQNTKHEQQRVAYTRNSELSQQGHLLSNKACLTEALRGPKRRKDSSFGGAADKFLLTFMVTLGASYPTRRDPTEGAGKPNKRYFLNSQRPQHPKVPTTKGRGQSEQRITETMPHAANRHVSQQRCADQNEGKTPLPHKHPQVYQQVGNKIDKGKHKQ